jgi:MscS family membrane protein
VRPRRTFVVGLLMAALVSDAAGQTLRGGDTPRAALEGFLDAARAGDFESAARYLDAGSLPGARRKALARQLGVVLDRRLSVHIDALSDEPQGSLEDGLAPHLERVQTFSTARGPRDVLLARGPTAHDWKVAATTVADIPLLYDEFGSTALERLIPPVLREVHVLDMALWQWIGLLVLVVLAYALSWLAATIALRVLGRVVRRSPTALAERVLERLGSPLRLTLALVVVSAGMVALGLSLPVRQLVVAVEKAGAIVIAAWALIRVVDVFADVVREALAARGRTPALAMVPVGSKMAKLIVAGFALLALLQNVGINVTGVLAGLGIGGLAVALAAQKSLENLFGGLTLIVDQPVRVGDFCRFGDRVGTVEEIGLRSTRLRTLDRTVVSIPNGEFAGLQLENFAQRDRVWLSARLGLRYETTPDQLRHVLVEIRTMLYAHPRVHPDPARIRFVGFGDYSLDLEIFAYVLTADYSEFLAIREDIYLRIMDIVAASGTGFAFPSQTTYLARDSGLDQARARAAEAEVRAWRERGDLCLPEFPPERVAQVRGTLDYPPAGTAADPSPGRA